MFQEAITVPLEFFKKGQMVLMKISISSKGLLKLGAAAILFAIAYRFFLGDFSPELLTASAAPILAAIYGKDRFSANAAKTTED